MHRLILAAMIAAPCLVAGSEARALPVTAVFDLTSPTSTIVAPAGGTAVFTADTGIKFSAYGGYRPSLGSGILPADVRTGPGGTGVYGDTIVNSFEYFDFFGPSKSDGTPLPGKWTAFSVAGNAASADPFVVELRRATAPDDSPLFFTISPADFGKTLRFTTDFARDQTWTLTLSNNNALFTIRSLEYTYDSDDIGTIPLPAGAWLLLGSVGGVGMLRAFARRRTA